MYHILYMYRMLHTSHVKTIFYKRLQVKRVKYQGYVDFLKGIPFRAVRFSCYLLWRL